MTALDYISKNRIRNILTLRYDPDEASPLSQKVPDDFYATESDLEGHKTERLLTDALYQAIQGHDKIAIALSGGVDSSLLLALIRWHFPEKKIFAIHYTNTNNNELERTRYLASRYNCGLTEVKLGSVFDNIQTMIELLDAPKWDAYDFIIPKAASKVADLLITGDGADELYGGYTFRYKQFLEIFGLCSWPNHHEVISAYLACHKNDFVEDQESLFAENENHHSFDFIRDIHPYLIANFLDDSIRLLSQVMLADYNGKLLHNFIIKKNAFARAFDITIASPFLDPKIRDFAPHLPLEQKYKDGVGKIILRKICSRFNLDPPLQKLGFTHDIKSEWSKLSSQYLSPILKPLALIYSLGIINPGWLKKNMLSDEERVINKIVSLYALEKYLRWKQ